MWSVVSCWAYIVTDIRTFCMDKTENNVKCWCPVTCCSLRERPNMSCLTWCNWSWSHCPGELGHRFQALTFLFLGASEMGSHHQPPNITVQHDGVGHAHVIIMNIKKCVLMLIGKARKSKTSVCIPLIFQVVEVCSQSNFTSFEYACIVMMSAHRSLVRSKCTGNGAAKGSAYCWWGRGMEEEKDCLEGHLCCHQCWKCCSWRLAWQWSLSKDACVLGALASHCKVAVVTQALTVEVWSAWVSLV